MCENEDEYVEMGEKNENESANNNSDISDFDEKSEEISIDQKSICEYVANK